MGVKTGSIGLSKTGITLALVAALVAAPYQIVWSRAAALTLKDLPITGAVEGECPKGAVMKIELADGRLLALGENGSAVMAEPSNEADGYPVVTLGVWVPETGELILHPKTKHKAQPGDSLCRDLFPEGA